MAKTGFTYDQPKMLKKRSVGRHLTHGTRPLLFMDCDSVLNGHQRHEVASKSVTTVFRSQRILIGKTPNLTPSVALV